MKIPSLAYFVGRRHGTGEPVGRPNKRTTYILSLLILLILPIISHAQKPGAFYFGDSDSNGVIEVPDLITLNTVLGNFSADDTLLYSGYPQSRYRQDLDGNGVIEVPDLIILNSWVPGDFSNRPGNPDRVMLDSDSITILPGASIEVSAYALSPIAAGSQPRTGFGIIFKIDPSSTCTTAQIYGYNVAGGATINQWRANAAYHYTLKPDSPDLGRAKVKVNTNGCANGTRVKLEVYIPDDSEAGVVPGRFPTKLSASQLLKVTISAPAGLDTFITSYPPDPVNSQDAAFEFDCSIPPCTYECKLDLGSWTTCASPKTYIGTESWTATTTTNAPSARWGHHLVWTGSEMIAWGGELNTGGRYNPVTDSWTSMSTTDAPTGRTSFAAVWNGTDMMVWGGTNGVLQIYGGRYFPSVDCWIGMSATNQPTPRNDFPSVWTGTRMIVWGGNTGSATNTGGLYDPLNNSWSATSTGANVPQARYQHTAVWTGTEMIVWGGHDGSSRFNTGGRYDPVSDNWLATSTGANLPSARYWHSAVWTGTEMIVWGGYSGTINFNTGGRYNPVSDSWLATSTVNAPSARKWIWESLGAVWSGDEMIVWGGDNGYPYSNDGGRYNPLSNTWTPTITLNAPSGRRGTDIIWTGTRVITWGGYDQLQYLNTGGIYFTGGGILNEGDHNFQVRAYDQEMNVDPTPAGYDWTIDLTPPVTTISSHPENPSGSYDADFEFSCNETGCTMECRLDSGAWNACASPQNFTGLSNGSHNFQVRATDPAGNIENPPAGFAWTIDVFPPETYIDAHPPDPTNQTSAVFTFHSSETGATIECNLDSMGWEPCDSPVSYSSLLVMAHTFQVRATDLAGNTDPTPASFDWTIDQTPPDTAITANPPDPDSNNYADFSFTCNQLPCTYQCNLDLAGWASCPSPNHYSALTNGSHDFQVRAIDQAGNVDPVPAAYNWTVNAVPPDTSITSQPANPSGYNYAAFEFSCSPGPCTFECRLDGSGWSSCISPKNYSCLSNSSHTFQVRATDLQNNTDPTPATYTWSVNAVTPETSITRKPFNPSNTTDPIFEFSCTGGPCTYECSLDSQAWQTCATPLSYTGLSEGPHNFRVRAYDAVGNVDTSPASYDWVIAFHDFWVKNTILRNVPEPRFNHTAIWTGSEMIVWGGYMGSGTLNSGSRYNPVSDSWVTISSYNAPSPRYMHTAIWTGSEMIVWGGCCYLNTGGKYNPVTDSWTTTGISPTLEPRYDHTAAWTGAEMIVWGGYWYDGDIDHYLDNGAKYDPVSDSWNATSTTNQPTGRRQHTAVWTGNEMVVWGGNGGAYLNTGARYDPLSDVWTATSTNNAPAARYRHGAVWTGNEMIVWGGCGSSPTNKNDGGRYNPVSDTWTPTSTTNAPTARYWFANVWTGSEMIVWGGAPSVVNTGGRYNPVSDTWTATSTTNAPFARQKTTGVWTGTEMIVWGGDTGSSKPVLTGGRYNPVSDSWIKTNSSNALTPWSDPRSVWTGSQMIVWSGPSTGWIYTPATDSITPTASALAPSSRDCHSLVWTGTEMIVWGGGSYLNTGGRYNPATNSWTATSTATAPVARKWHSAIWTGTEMIIWGGTNNGPLMNDGKKYNPTTDLWYAMTSTGAPAGRFYHRAFWTGDTMIIWGCGGTKCNTGGRYYPSSNTWAATTTTNAPESRENISAVWTGTEMIIWGGYDSNIIYFNNGARYNPVTDSWQATSTTNAPVGRRSATAVFTGSKMIVWGGYNGAYLNDGGVYSLASDSWTPMSTLYAPHGRSLSTSVWTGNEMVVWGGSNGSGFGTGGIYVP